MADGIRIDAQLDHRPVDLPPSQVRTSGTLTWTDDDVVLDLSTDLQPLSFTAWRVYSPDLPVSGDVRAMVGGRDFRQSKFNRATQSLRQAGLPTMRDPDWLIYYREEVGGLLMGGYERKPTPWSLKGIPADFNSKLLAPDWDRFMPIMKNAIRRTPQLETAEIVQ